MDTKTMEVLKNAGIAKETTIMKTFRIYYRLAGVTYKRTPFRLVKAADPAAALEAFRAAAPHAAAVAVFAD